jgi:hypothetical protein
MQTNSCLLVTPLNTANELVQDVKEAIKRRKRPFVVFCGILLAAQLTVVVCLAQTHLNDHVDAALSVDPANLDRPDAGNIIGSYRSFKDFNYYDWDAWFDPGSSSSAEGGFTIPVRPAKNMPAIAMTCSAVFATAAVGPKLSAPSTATMAPMPTAITGPGRIRVIQSKRSNGTNGNPAAFQAK